MNTKVIKNFEKRHYFSKEIVLEMLDNYGIELFQAYREGLEHFNEEIQRTGAECRTRLEATLLNAKILDSLINHFPNNWVRGKYGRILFNFGNITLIVKKLSKKDKPYNIPTALACSITEQYQASLFDGDEDAKENALLIFGYTKNRLGEYVNPRIVLYDGYSRWVIHNEDFIKNPSLVIQKIEEPIIKLKEVSINRKAE